MPEQSEFGPSSQTRRDELEKALDPLSGTKKILKYPEDIEDIDHWVAFTVHEHEFRREADFPLKNTLQYLFLPMPAGLQTGYSQDYANESLGLGGKIGADAAALLKEGGVKSVINAAGDIVMDQKTMKDAAARMASAVKEDAAAGIAAILGAAFGGGIAGAAATAALTAAAGKAVEGALGVYGVSTNPYMAVIYNSPQLRTHNFSWKFTPRSVKESITLKEIINIFKYHSSPGIGNNPHFFDYPQQFDIDFHYAKYLYNIGPSVLTNMSVDYHAEGQPLYHSIGEDSDPEKTPVSVVIQLSFQETSLVTKETINTQDR